MPNWAYCELSVIGDSESAADFWSKFLLRDADGVIEGANFGKLVPLVGEAFDAFGEPTGVVLDGSDPDAYDYYLAIKLWGTKWEPSDVQWSSSDSVYFECAWNGPAVWLETVSALYPLLDFSLVVAEPGCDFSYRVQYSNGVLTYEDEGNFATFCYFFGWDLCPECDLVMGVQCSCHDGFCETVLTASAS